jgi:hypothetical protein
MMMKVPSLLLALVGFVSTVQAVRDDVMVLMYETDASLENDPSSPLYFFKQKGKVADIKTTVYGGNLGTFDYEVVSFCYHFTSLFLTSCVFSASLLSYSIPWFRRQVPNT